MSSKSFYNIPKLKGSENYIPWAMRIESFLIKEKLNIAISSENSNKSEEALANIRLFLEDGPLMQIKHIINTKLA